MFKKLLLLWYGIKQARRHAPLARQVALKVRVMLSEVLKGMRKK